jgi:hypothetical protein
VPFDDPARTPLRHNLLHSRRPRHHDAARLAVTQALQLQVIRLEGAGYPRSTCTAEDTHKAQTAGPLPDVSYLDFWRLRTDG